MNGFCERSVYVDTEDGVLLGGTLVLPTSEPKPVVVVWVHGWPVSPRLPFTTEIARGFADLGYAFLAGDTRGHDLATWLFRQDGKPMLGGAWYERFEECPRDLSAWLDLCGREGFDQALLLGHSFGALKATYYQAERGDARVIALALAAPSVRPYLWGPERRPTEERTAHARRLVDEGRGLELLPWAFHYGSPMGTASAETYLSWLGADELDMFGLRWQEPRVGRVRCPIFGCYGTADPDTGGLEDLNVIRDNAVSSSRVDVCLLDGANHGFVGHERALARQVHVWVQALG